MNIASADSAGAVTLPFISVCVCCKRKIVSGLTPVGDPLPSMPGQSHAICGDCLSKAFHDLALGEEQRRILPHLKD